MTQYTGGPRWRSDTPRDSWKAFPTWLQRNGHADMNSFEYTEEEFADRVQDAEGDDASLHVDDTIRLDGDTGERYSRT
jgi:hypothetical protein